MGKNIKDINWCGASLEQVMVGDMGEIIYGDTENDNSIISYLRKKKSQRAHSSWIYTRKIKDPFSTSNNAVRGVYAFSNENLDNSLGKLDFDGKSVLTVGSSGDQTLMAILGGATKITLADANPMAKYYVQLKLAAIKNLSQDHFNFYFEPSNIFNPKCYAQVSHDLDPESKTFWDSIIMDVDESIRIEMIHNMFHDYSFTPFSVFSYRHNKSVYDRLQQQLRNVEIDYQTCDFLDFHKIDGKYDAILLSNVYDYITNRRFNNEIAKISEKLLNKDGFIQVLYQLFVNNLDKVEVLEFNLKKKLPGGKLKIDTIHGELNSKTYQLIYYNGKSPFKNVDKDDIVIDDFNMQI